MSADSYFVRTVSLDHPPFEEDTTTGLTSSMASESLREPPLLVPALTTERGMRALDGMTHHQLQPSQLSKNSSGNSAKLGQDTIYLCNFRVSVDGEWLCLKELQDLDGQDSSAGATIKGRLAEGGQPSPHHRLLQSTANNNYRNSWNGTEGIVANSTICSDDLLVGRTTTKTANKRFSDSNWANFYSRDPAAIERSNLVNICKLVVKELLEQSLRFGRMLDSDHLPLQHFFIVLEHVMRHGLRPKKGLLGPKKELWDIMASVEKYAPEAQDITASIRDLPTVKTHIGRARAWLRLALMQKKLGDYLQALVDNRDEALAEYYEPYALMMSDEIILIMGILVGLNVIDCNLCVKEEDLDSQQGVIDFSLYLRSSSRTSPMNEVGGEDNGGGGGGCETALVAAHGGGETPAAVGVPLGQGGGGGGHVVAENNMTTVLDQKNYIEELNRHLNATVTNLQGKVESLTTTNALMKEDLAIARNSLLALQAENAALRRGKSATASNLSDKVDPDGVDKTVAEERRRRMELEKELSLQVSLKAESDMAMKLLEKDIHEKQDTIISLRRQLDDIKSINLEMYKKLQECESSLRHKTDLIAKLESQKETMANAISQLDNKVYSENASIATMAEQTQVLSMQMVSCEERLARAETDLRVEREWRNSLQSREVQLKEQITGYKLEIRDLGEDRRQKEQLKQDLDALQKRYQDSERTLEELGMQLSLTKLQIVDMKEKTATGAAVGDNCPSTPTTPSASISGNASWTPDKMSIACVGCGREFSMTRRKHHCRSCGKIFCNACSDNVIPLPLPNSGNEATGQILGKPVRVCDTCWVQLNSMGA